MSFAKCLMVSASMYLALFGVCFAGVTFVAWGIPEITGLEIRLWIVLLSIATPATAGFIFLTEKARAEEADMRKNGYAGPLPMPPDPRELYSKGSDNG